MALGIYTYICETVILLVLNVIIIVFKIQYSLKYLPLKLFLFFFLNWKKYLYFPTMDVNYKWKDY